MIIYKINQIMNINYFQTINQMNMLDNRLLLINSIMNNYKI